MSRRLFCCAPDKPLAAQVAANEICQLSLAQQAFEVVIRPPSRTLDANAAMWATLTDIARQVEWPYALNGQWHVGLLSKDDWKIILTAAFEQETKMAQGIEGGTVMMGARTSHYSRRKMGELIAFVHAFGAEHNVQWSARAQDEYAEFGPKKKKDVA